MGTVMTTMEWALWAALLIAQNFAFTFVSRARTSASLKRHVCAAMMSNGVWFFGQLIVLDKFMKILTGHFGWWQAALVGMFYTTFTIVGSVSAHKISMMTERGKAAVGASDKYAQITKEQWLEVADLIAERRRGQTVAGFGVADRAVRSAGGF